MFCPNCGTQNPEGTQACSKCGFQMKGAAAPKFKGTMMMNQGATAPTPPAPPVAPRPPPPAAIPGQGPGAAGGPSAFKGTVVGVAAGGFGGGIAPTPPRAPSNPPAAYGAPPPEPQRFGSQPPYAPMGGGGGAGNVNPMGSTVADTGANYGGGATPSPFMSPAAQQPPQDAGYGPPQGQQQGYGGGGYGAPPQGQPFGAPPSQQQPYGAPPPYDPNAGQNPGGMQVAQQYGAPQQYGQAYGAPGGMPGQAGMMAPGGPGGGMMGGGDGTNGPKGTVRKGTQVLLYTVLSCGIYQIIWLIQTCNEMKAFLKRDEPSWVKLWLLSTVTCGFYAMYWYAVRLGALIAECQQRAGVQNPQNLGWMYIIPYYNLILATDELNKAWQTPG